MKALEKDLTFEFFRGQGPGGQHKNKTNSCVRCTHAPTGVSVVIDGRHQQQNKRKAIREVNRRLAEHMKEMRAARRKAERDYKIHNTETVRTYDYSRGVATDHRTGRVAPLKKILVKGQLDLMR